MEFVKVFTVKNSADFLKSLEGKMIRVGTDLKAKKDVSEIKNFRKNKSILVVLGNEEKGISKSVRESCDELVIIKGKGDIESLNVAQAASVIFYNL